MSSAHTLRVCRAGNRCPLFRDMRSERYAGRLQRNQHGLLMEFLLVALRDRVESDALLRIIGKTIFTSLLGSRMITPRWSLRHWPRASITVSPSGKRGVISVARNAANSPWLTV